MQLGTLELAGSEGEVQLDCIPHTVQHGIQVTGLKTNLVASPRQSSLSLKTPIMLFKLARLEAL